MSDRPTPETDVFVKNSEETPWSDWVYADKARKLERDEARNKLADAMQEVDLRVLDFERMKGERDEARELAAAYKEYAQLLCDEINDMVLLANVHGWKSFRYEQGKVLREKIKQMEESK